MSYIMAEKLVKKYGNGEATVTAVSDISFQIESGEFVGVMGESGAGKSTLLSIMGAMNAPTSGRFVVDDIDIYNLKQEKQADFRREFLGFIFQSFHLVPYLTVFENVMLPLTIIKKNKRQKRAMVENALSEVGLLDKADRLPNQIHEIASTPECGWYDHHHGYPQPGMCQLCAQAPAGFRWQGG
jgi:putative ABC transport system ATP-binding protein